MSMAAGTDTGERGRHWQGRDATGGAGDVPRSDSGAHDRHFGMRPLISFSFMKGVRIYERNSRVLIPLHSVLSKLMKTL